MWNFTLYLLCASLGVLALELKVDHAMENAGIVPDVIPVAPKEMLHVSYPSGVKAELGNELTPTQVKDQPSVIWNYEPNSFYTLSFINPDAPSRVEPKFKEVNIWLVGNVPGGNVDMGITLTAYMGSAPPQKSGLHRYVFLVYKQPSQLIFDEQFISNRTAELRMKFSIHKFALKYDLGTPVAGNFYEAQYDDYVPILYKQIGFEKVKKLIKYT